MQGLKTQESNKFNKYWDLIQAEAKKKNSVFFAECGEGRDFETEEMEGEDFSGWLVPQNKVNEFQIIWDADTIEIWDHEEYNEYHRFINWKINNGIVSIDFHKIDSLTFQKVMD
ncbi:hypothetical protein [Treponema phagedenis]|uniref:hypothetical protein n=1 Tax=Treponema phagedenis TaxID=162 RepID=UPI0001F63A7E|nr:hypothetical protein [Treponema phagedenis]EFW38952.1 hypothetical protein HMPREF9554_00527 [Treponema phagedenis F0421]TYT79762.1 hypothetical protein FS559_12150 [Treponema phagedenis]